MRPHDEFLELCAVATSGELSKEEQRRLNEHLAVCPECRQALKEFETVVDVGVPLLSSELSTIPSQQSNVPTGEVTPDTVWKGISSETPSDRASAPPRQHNEEPVLAYRKRRQRTQLNWNLAWLPFAAAILLTVALGISAYRIGKGYGLEVSRATTSAADQRLNALEQQSSDAGHERELLGAQLAQRSQMISGLRHQVEQQSAALNKMKTAQANLEQSIQTNQSAKQQAVEESATLAQKLGAAQATLEKMQSELDAARQQRSQGQVQVAGLESQIDNLSSQLREREETIDRQDAFLAHDRDIRELMGARDLYIAEVYDVERNGTTRKPFGRVFYTKGKSLVFYAYDLDQQAGVKNASTFQAWGRRGPDKEEALNLGIFYQDNAAKKRWVLKFDNPKELAEIDAVFVTVEPKGGSHKPSGKPLLFAYLKINPNHP